MKEQDEVGAVTELKAAIVAQNEEAAEALVAMLTTANEATLVAWLADEDVDLQWWAIRALAACGTVAAVAPLLPHLQSPSAELRSVAVMALGRITMRQPAAMSVHLPQLSGLLSDSDGLVRQVTANTLAQCGAIAIPLLIELLRFSNDQGARSRAAYALAKIGTAEAAPALYRSLNDPNYLVHLYAHEALDKMGLLENLLLQP